MDAFNKTCSRPNGNVIFVPVLLATVAWCFSISATAQCSFVTRKVSTSLPIAAGSSISDQFFLSGEQGIGFWGWETPGGQCLSYTINGQNPKFDFVFKLSKALTGVSDIVGGLAMTALWTSTCLPVTPQKFRQWGCLIVVAMIAESLAFLIMTSNVCGAGFFSYALEEPNNAASNAAPAASCGIANGAIWAAMAALFWAFAAAACMKMPSSKEQEQDGTVIAASEGGMETVDASTMDGTGMAVAGAAAGAAGGLGMAMSSEQDLGMGMGMGMSTMQMGMGGVEGDASNMGELGVVGEGDEGEEYGEDYGEENQDAAYDGGYEQQNQGGYENQDAQGGGYEQNQEGYENQGGYDGNQGGFENQGDFNEQGGEEYQEEGQAFQAGDYPGQDNQGTYEDQGQGQGPQDFQGGQDYQPDEFQGNEEPNQGEEGYQQEQGADDKGYTN